MTNENDLMQKLLISKKIMEKHNELPRQQGGAQTLTAPMVENFTPVSANYNIPQEIIQETAIVSKPAQYVNSQDKIMSSKLPEAIKQLMIEHPIHQPQMGNGPTLSNELVEKASRLMKNGGETITETATKRQSQTQTIPDNKEFRKMLKEVVEEVLSENGMLVESVSKSNDIFSFRVGKHIFEGKVTKVKKVS